MNFGHTTDFISQKIQITEFANAKIFEICNYHMKPENKYCKLILASQLVGAAKKPPQKNHWCFAKLSTKTTQQKTSFN